MQFPPKKPLSVDELQGLPFPHSASYRESRGTPKRNTHCSSYICHQTLQVHPSVPMIPDWHLLIPSNINLYRRRVSPLYSWVMWPPHTNASMLYLITPWTSVESGQVCIWWLSARWRTLHGPLDVQHGEGLHDPLRSILPRCSQANRLEQDRTSQFAHPAWTYCSQLATTYSTLVKSKTLPTTLQFQVGLFRLLYRTWTT